MARIFITGSADGLGLLAAQALIRSGHQVVLHARNEARAKTAIEKAPGAETYFAADLSRPDETIALARQVNDSGPFDAIIHNAAVYNAPGEQILYVNTLAPYILTSLLDKPRRLIYLSSSMHLQGRFRPEQLRKNGSITYSDSKLHILMLTLAVARKWKDVRSNALDPGWVPTKMGGAGAPDNLQKGYETQVWLASAEDPAASVTGKYFYHKEEKRANPEAYHESLQEELLRRCREVTGIDLPGQ